MRKNVSSPMSKGISEQVKPLQSPPQGDCIEHEEDDRCRLGSKQFGSVMETQIAVADREKQRALEQKAREVASKD